MRSQCSGSHRPRESGCLRHGAGRTGVARSDCGWPSTDQTVVFLRFLTISLSGRLRVLFRLVVFFLRAVVLLAVVRFRDVPLRFRVAAAFFAARDLTADFRFRVAAAFFAAVVRFRLLVFLAVVFLRAGAFLRAVDLRAVDFLLLRAVAMVTSSPRSGRHALQASSLSLAHASPHAVPLVAAQRVVEALDPDRALGADALRLARRSTLLGEEDLRVELPAPRPLLPWDVVVHPPPPSSNYTSVILDGAHHVCPVPMMNFFHRRLKELWAGRTLWITQRDGVGTTRSYVVVRCTGTRPSALIASMNSCGSFRMPCSEPAMREIVSSINVPPKSFAPPRRITSLASMPSFTHET